MSRKEGINDKTLAKIMGIYGRAMNKIVLRTKGEKPFATVETEPDELLWATNHLGVQDVNQLIDENGVDKVNSLFAEAATIQNRRAK